MTKLLLCAVLCQILPGAMLCAQQWGTRLDGKPLTELAPRDARAVMLFFVASDCPISDRTFPEMNRLREEFASQGVRTWFVYPNTNEQAATIEVHQKAFDPTGEALQDTTGALVRLAHAIATPELAVLIPSNGRWRSVYTGQIDNRYVRLGLERPAATEHFGEEAVRAVLSGKIPKPPVGNPVGCAIMNPGVR